MCGYVQACPSLCLIMFCVPGTLLLEWPVVTTVLLVLGVDALGYSSASPARARVVCCVPEGEVFMA